jgi:ADP-heptose:LPS heptosyltransferase
MAVDREGDHQAVKILVILASGIGNTILFGPTLKALREGMPDARIDVFAYKPSFAEPFRAGRLVDSVVPFEGAGTLRRLRRERYDVSICAFPSNRWQFNVFAFLAGARKRITHSYRVGRMTTLGFLQNCRIPADENLHDVDQNLALLSALGIERPAKPLPFFSLSDESKRKAGEFLRENRLQDRRLVGVHAGGGPIEWKRVPIDRFIEQINSRIADDSTVIVFGGPEEGELKQEIKRALSCPCVIFDGPLAETAALIHACAVFITNDSGLMHIAAVSPDVQIIALFNGTNPGRTRPCSDNSEVVMLAENRLQYPFRSTSPTPRG